MDPTRVLLSWSSGKDSAWALHELRSDPTVEVVGLLTTFNAVQDRVAMHAVRRRLVSAQADAVGLPLWAVEIPDPCSNDDYARAMSSAMVRAVDEGVGAVAFGDLYLEDIRAYREQNLAAVGLGARFPLWLRDTRALAEEMIAAGLRAHITCVDPAQCSADLCGREWSEVALELPESADPCGENGEFHTFCWAGPMYSAPIEVTSGEIVERGGFRFADLLPAS